MFYNIDRIDEIVARSLNVADFGIDQNTGALQRFPELQVGLDAVDNDATVEKLPDKDAISGTKI